MMQVGPAINIPDQTQHQPEALQLRLVAILSLELANVVLILGAYAIVVVPKSQTVNSR